MYAIFTKRIEYILCPWLEGLENPGSFSIKITLPSGVMLGEPIIAIDGQTAYNHAFTEDDETYLANLGGVVVESLPEGWEYVEDEL